MGRMGRDSCIADLMNLLHRLRDWWCDLIEAWREPLDDGRTAQADRHGSDYPQHQFDDPVPDGFDLRAMQPPLSFLDTFPGEQEDDK